MNSRYSLRPQTIERISQAQTPVPASIDMTLQAYCMAYKSADQEAARLSQCGDPKAQVAAVARDHFYANLKPLLEKLVQ
jgi:hypothetical protein